ncbi:MAG: T9SS type A sorting domain-containing protein [Saprospiraceae bacterium]
MLLRLLLVTSILVLAKAGYAQPEITFWPDRGTSTTAQTAPTVERQMLCTAPDNTVISGSTKSFELDPDGFYATATFIGGPPTLSFGTASLQGDTLIYTASSGVLSGGLDIISVDLCDLNGANCNQLDYVVGVGRQGLRDSEARTIVGGDTEVIKLQIPDGDLFCGSVIDNGFYEYAARRVARFTQYVPGDSLLYQSSRGPGMDELIVVVCNDFGTCDTTEISITITAPTIELPFLEDFSGQGTGTDPRLWLEEDVFVNDGFPVQAPSIGAATFDGIDASGQPYGEGFGATDVLTSSYINLSPFDGSSNIYLKYYYQLGGRGLAPESDDELRVSARKLDGDWFTLRSHNGSRSRTQDDTFRYVSVSLDSAFLFHDKFQIRFEMFSNLNGALDVFNLDYVRVEQSSNGGPSFRDIALSQPPPSILTPYTAMPYEQFEGRSSIIRDELPVGLFNHFDRQNNISTSQVLVTDANGLPILDAALLTAAQFNLDQGYTYADVAIPAAPLSTFRTVADGLSRAEAKKLTTTYTLGIDQDQIGLEAVLRNDTASTITAIDDYYSYDDGSAESGLLNTAVGDASIVRYELFVADTLRGIRFAFPRLNELDVADQLINIIVHIDSSGVPMVEPIYTQLFARPFFPSDVGDSLQALTTYRLEDASGNPTELILQPGGFYVGWQQISDENNPLIVGLDLSNDNFDQVWSEFGFGWSRTDEFLTEVKASLMIHPVFSTEELQNSSPTAEVEQLSLKLYPNPSRGQVTLSGLPDDIGSMKMHLFDLTGRLLQSQSAQSQIDLSVAPGMYLLQLENEQGQRIFSERVIVY